METPSIPINELLEKAKTHTAAELAQFYSSDVGTIYRILARFQVKAGCELEKAQKEKQKWGLYAEKIERERDHYKAGLEEISSSIEDWLNSLIQEPSLDFIHAIKAWADKKLKEL